MYALIKSFKINWSKVNRGQRWFIKLIPEVLNEIFTYVEVSESFYDTNKFPMNKNYDGNVWNLRSIAYHLARSKVLYHPTVIKKTRCDNGMYGSKE